MTESLTRLMERIAVDSDFMDRLAADKSILASEIGWSPEAIESFSFNIETNIACGSECGCGSYPGSGGCDDGVNCCTCTNSGGSGSGGD